MNVSTKIDCVDCDKTIDVLDYLITPDDISTIEESHFITLCQDDINSRNITVTYEADVELWHIILSVGGVCTTCLKYPDSIPTYE